MLGVVLLVVVSCAGRGEGAGSDLEAALYAGLQHPNHCHTKLICLIAGLQDNTLKSSDFLRGIKTLSVLRKNYKTYQLAVALKTGETGGDCTAVAPSCPLASADLLEAVSDMGLASPDHRTKRDTSYADTSRRTRRVNPRRPGVGAPLTRRQSNFFSNMPPVFRPEAATSRRVCQTCDSRRTVCTVYSIGTYAGCTGVWLVAGFPGQVACNVATAPGSFGCGMNTLNCYMQGCGLVQLPKLP